MEASPGKLACLANGIPLKPLPPLGIRNPQLPHAPKLIHGLDKHEQCQALANALRYFPVELHDLLAGEFAAELAEYGHIYMYRFKPDRDILKAHPLTSYPAQCTEAAAIMLMISNNLDAQVAQFPEELVTYGGNGQVFSNWAQFWLVMQALSRLTVDQTFVLYSGHPMGIFPSHASAPRMVVTNGMLVPNAGLAAGYDKLFALGVTQYGQMTAGSFCYIGPQGIVHGTTLTLLNALRKRVPAGESDESLTKGRVFVTSGLGGMSGAQPKAAVITGCIGVVAEISEDALLKRYEQGWLNEWTADLTDLMQRIRKYRAEKKAVSIGFLGNVVDVWEKLAEVHHTTGELLVDVGSDQTSCHNPFLGGYYPVGISYNEARQMMASDPDRFKSLVNESLKRHIKAINYLSSAGIYFFDYGNAFLLMAQRAGAKVNPTESQIAIAKKTGIFRQFRYPSYVQDIMGDIFSLGFGPFRWVCSSGLAEDLATTDNLAGQVIRQLLSETNLPAPIEQQYKDNLHWIENSVKHNLVVGSQARILYSDEAGRIAIARAFNKAVRDGVLKGPIIISRDHHDVSGTDSPYRETSNIYDGSAVCADMAVQNVIGGAARGASWVSLHNGGGVGWGEVMNGGFGHVLDGSPMAGEKAYRLLAWDVTNGVARRAWSGHPLARLAIERSMKQKAENVFSESAESARQTLEVLLPNITPDRDMLLKAVEKVAAIKN